MDHPARICKNVPEPETHIGVGAQYLYRQNKEAVKRRGPPQSHAQGLIHNRKHFLLHMNIPSLRKGMELAAVILMYSSTQGAWTTILKLFLFAVGAHTISHRSTVMM